jgi:hypothetical protein
MPGSLGITNYAVVGQELAFCLQISIFHNAGLDTHRQHPE